MRKAVLFGSSGLGKLAIELLKDYLDIEYFCDNDPQKWGSEAFGIKVLSPKELAESKFDGIIIVTSQYFNQIKDQLEGLGLKNIIRFDMGMFFKKKTDEATIAELLEANSDLSITISITESKFYKSYKKIREPKRVSHIHTSGTTNNYADTGQHPAHLFLEKIKPYNITVKDYEINKDDYLEYMDKAGYNLKAYNTNVAEKSLEHFVSAQMLDLNEHDIYIDVASNYSPVPEIYSRLYGLKAYRQDLFFSKGLSGDMIGGDAANMPVPPEFASKMALHCSFEHFEGESDSKFMKEIARVLKPGGKVCILPLYVNNYEYIITTDPVVAVREDVEFEKDAIVDCVEIWDNRHGRKYDAEHFIDRIYNHIDSDVLEVELYKISGAEKISPKCYLSLAMLVTKK